MQEVGLAGISEPLSVRPSASKRRPASRLMRARLGRTVTFSMRRRSVISASRPALRRLIDRHAQSCAYALQTIGRPWR